MGSWIYSLSSSVFAELPFMAFFFLTQGEEEVWPGGTQPMLFPESSCIYIPSFRYVAQGIFWQKCHIWFPPNYHILAHVLSWVKNCHHAKFQRNLPTGLARMMVQTNIQTDKHTDISFYIYIYMSLYTYIYTSSIYQALPGQCQHENLYKPLKFQPGWPFN